MAINPVITSVQARQITRGRTPLVPVEYEAAVTALQACITLDETRYWSDKADALAAWARIYRNDDAGLKAKRLKLHAYRRMGEIAAELRPLRGRKQGVGVGKGALPGPRSLLKEHGLSTAESDAARTLATIPRREFNTLLRNPVAPTTARHMVRDHTIWHESARTLMTCRSMFRRHTPAQVIAIMTDVEKANAKELVSELTEWLDDFDSRLRK
jgi:hypothetical protein